MKKAVKNKDLILLSIQENSELYKAEKERIADQVITLLDKRFPGLTTQVEMRDVATHTDHLSALYWQLAGLL